MITVPTTERIAQTMDDCKLSCQNRYSNIPRMDECHSYCEKKKKDTLLQRSNGCN